MKPRIHDITMRLWLEHKRLKEKRNEPEVTPMPPIHDDLGGLTAVEIDNEIAVVRRRIEQGTHQPEGLAGLNYRLGRLQAQLAVVKKKERKM